MGQKVNPTGFRVGITEDWKSKWYAPKAAYGTFLVEDHKVRRLIDAKLNRRPPFAAVSDILIERTREEVTITLKRDGDATMLTLHHERFFDEKARDGHERGWSGTLEKLARYLS